MRLPFLAAVVAVLPCMAVAAESASTRYSCDRGAVVLATYLTIADQSLAVLAFEGRQLGFAQDTSASGARYVSTDPAQPYVWWSKGDTAMLIHGSGDAEALVYGDCRAVK